MPPSRSSWAPSASPAICRNRTRPSTLCARPPSSTRVRSRASLECKAFPSAGCYRQRTGSVLFVSRFARSRVFLIEMPDLVTPSRTFPPGEGLRVRQSCLGVLHMPHKGTRSRDRHRDEAGRPGRQRDPAEGCPGALDHDRERCRAPCSCRIGLPGPAAGGGCASRIVGLSRDWPSPPAVRSCASG